MKNFILFIFLVVCTTTFGAGSLSYLKSQQFVTKHITTPSNPASGHNKLYSKSDDKLYFLTSAGAEANLLTSPVGLAGSDVSGTLPTTKGGTGIATYTTGDILYSSASNVLSVLAAGTNGHVLTLAGGVPTWAAGGGGGVSSIGTINSQTKSANGAVVSGSTLVMQEADATSNGLVSTSAQTLAGVKTFSSAPNLSSLTASLPLKLDGSKNVTSAAIDLTSAEVTGTLPLSKGGFGVLDTVYAENFESSVVAASLTSGNNAAVLGGGSIAGTLADDTTTPLDKSKSIKYTQAGGSLNDYFCGPVISLERKPRNNYLGANFYYKYTGSDSDVGFIIYDVTNSTTLTTSLDLLKAATESTRYSTAVFVPSTTSQIRWCFQVKVLNSAKILTFDDVEFSLDPFKLTTIKNNTDIVDGGVMTIGATTTAPTKGTIVEDKILWSREGQRIIANYKYEQSSSGAIGSGDYLFTLPGGLSFDSSLVTFYTGSLYNSANSQQAARSYIGSGMANVGAGSGYMASVVLVAYDATRFRVVLTATANGNGGPIQSSPLGSSGYYTFDLSRVAYSFQVNAPISGWTSSTSNIVTPQVGADSYIKLNTGNSWGSTNTEIRRFLTTTENTSTAITYADSATLGATFTINEDGLYYMTYSDYNISGSFYFFGISRNSNQLTTNIGSITGTHRLAQTKVSGLGTAYTELNTVTAVEYLKKGDVIRAHSGASSTSSGDTDSRVSFYIAKVGYKTLSAVKSPEVCYFKDIKTTGTSGGSFNSGAWQTRVLNTVNQDGSSTSASCPFATLSSNQVILSPGEYEIEANAIGHNVNKHQIRIRNISDSTTPIVGTSEYADAASNTNRSFAFGTFSPTTSKTIEVQHQCETSKASTGFGLSNSFGESELYAQMKIKKVR